MEPVDGGRCWEGKRVQVLMVDENHDEMILELALFVGYWVCVRSHGTC